MAKKPGQLHETLAVIGSLEGAKDLIVRETRNTFKNKQNLFLGAHKETIMFDQDRQGENLVAHQEISTTIDAKLNYMTNAIIRFWDAKLQKEMAAQNAVADIIVDDTTIVEGVPVYYLLEMEKELKALREVYSDIPTLAPGTKWVEDSSMGEGIWKSKHPVETLKSEKTIEPKVLYEATKEFPAQIKEYSINTNVGRSEQYDWSGMISPAEKSMILARFDKLLRSIKKARQRANNTEVPKSQIGDAIFCYLHTKE